MNINNYRRCVISIIFILFQRGLCSYFSIKLEAVSKPRIKNETPNDENQLILLEDYSNLESESSTNIINENSKHIFKQDLLKNNILNLLNNENNFAVVNIMNYYNVQYYGNIFVGSSKQVFTVIFDTGSNLLWLSSKDCMQCRNYTEKFSYDQSTTYKNLFNNKNITYAIGFVDGRYVEDSVYIGKRSEPESPSNSQAYLGVEEFKFLLVDYEEYLDGTISDGVMGLGLDYEEGYNSSFIHMLYLKGHITAPLFYFYLSESRTESRLYIGDISKENEYLDNKFKRMSYCSVSTLSRYWQCDLSSIDTIHNGHGRHTDNSNEIPADSPRNNTSFSYSSSSKVIFDTGTSFLIIPLNDFIYLAPIFTKKALDNKCAISSSLQFMCKCNSPSDFDNIELNLKSSGSQINKLTIVTENLIDYVPILDYQCHFQILLDIFLGNFWILGDSVLRDSLISFDMQERKIGWIQNFVKIDDSKFQSLKETEIQNIAYLYLYIFVFLFVTFSVLYTYILWKCCCNYNRSQNSQSRNENLI